MKRLAVAVLAAVVLTGTASAADWKWEVTPYIWMNDATSDVSVHDDPVTNSTVPFKDLLDHLEFVAEVHAEGRTGKHGVLADLMYVALHEDGAHFDLPKPDGAEALAEADYDMTIFEAAGLFNPSGDGERFTLIYGLRYLDQSLDLDVEFDIAPGIATDRQYDGGGSFLDGMVGARWAGHFAPRWSWSIRADVSTGGTKLTWAGTAGAGYSFDEAARYTLLAGYRYLDIDLDSDETVETDSTYKGFITGFRFSF